MCATKNCSYLKQYFRNKLKKWGYKFFVLSGIDEYVYNFELHTGDSHPEPDFGALSNVVVQGARILRNVNHKKFYHGNWCTSLPSAVCLQKKGI